MPVVAWAPVPVWLSTLPEPTLTFVSSIEFQSDATGGCSGRGRLRWFWSILLWFDWFDTSDFVSLMLLAMGTVSGALTGDGNVYDVGVKNEKFVWWMKWCWYVCFGFQIGLRVCCL